MLKREKRKTKRHVKPRYQTRDYEAY